MFGKLVHYSFDAVLVSACLAGIRRSTGLELAVTQAPKGDIALRSSHSEGLQTCTDARALIKQYLDIGDWALDIVIVVVRFEWGGRGGSSESDKMIVVRIQQNGGTHI